MNDYILLGRARVPLRRDVLADTLRQLDANAAPAILRGVDRVIGEGRLPHVLVAVADDGTITSSRVGPVPKAGDA